MRWKAKIGSDKEIPLKELLPFVFLIGTSTALGKAENWKLTIKKCCPKGQELNSSLMCVDAPGELKNNTANDTEDVGGRALSDDPSELFFPGFNDSSTENNSSLAELLPWFPFPSLISPLTLQPMPDFRSVGASLGRASLLYGAHPDCPSDEKDWTCFKPRHSEQFRLLLSPQQDMKLYVSKRSSFHDGRGSAADRGCGFLRAGPVEGAKAKEGVRILGAEELRTFPSDDFCVDRGPGGSYVAEYCPCKTVPCLRKCCGDAELFDESKQKCVPNSTFGFWRPSLENSNITRNYYLLSSRLPSSCKMPQWVKIPHRANLNFKKSCGSQLNQEERNKFYFLSDGSLQVNKKSKKIPARSYCGDHMMYDPDDFVENNFLLCLENDGSLEKFRIYGILFVVGGIVLLVTVAISLYLPELRSSVYSKVIICHNVSLMLADFIWGSTYLLPYVTHKLCIFLSLAIQCTFLGSFFWMNVMCLDISIGFRRLRSTAETLNGSRKFLWYLTYACGAPIIITSVTAAMEFAPSLPPHYIRPGFGCYNCGFNPDSPAIFVYVYGPMMAIILLNIIFFIMTVLQINKLQKQTVILANQKSSASTIRNGKKRLVIFGKLFLLMGLSWIMEIVGWVVGGQEYYWYLPDFVNILRAVFIFSIIVCKKKVLRSLLAKLKGCPDESVKINRNSTASKNQLPETRKGGKTPRKQISQTFSRSEESGV